MDTIKEFKSVEALVRVLMTQDERCRNDDKWLTFRVFEEIAKANNERIYLPFKLFSQFPAFETVKRTRAKIQNVEKVLLPTDPQVLLKRQRREQEVKDYVRYG